MEDTSLEKALDNIIAILDRTEMPLVDKVELMTNLRHFLDAKTYRDNVDTLAKRQLERKMEYGGK